MLSGGWIMLFVLVRTVGGFGNINPSLVATDTSKSHPFLSSWNVFFNTIKYPPDLAFSSLFLAINHVCLSVFFLLPTETNKFYMKPLLDGPLMDFGRSALFFYVTHFLVFSTSADTLGYFFPNLNNSNDQLDLNLWQFLLVWLALLCLLWGMCRLYARFKERQQPDSIFRFF
jgi:hypothetical protein